jgi:LysM repeat protein
MATVRVRVPVPTFGRHRRERDITIHQKATIKLGRAVLTLPVTSPEVRHTDIAAEWVQIPRPGQRPLLRKGADTLRQMQMTVLFVKKNGQHVENGLKVLEWFSNAAEPVVVAYGPFEAGRWRMTDVDVRSVRRQFGTNAITQAEVALTFVQAFDDGYKRPPSAKPPAAATGGTSATAPKPSPKAAPTARTHTVRRGETLSKIAADHYGDPNRYPEIARANGIKNPHRIYPGQKLRIP